MLSVMSYKQVFSNRAVPMRVAEVAPASAYAGMHRHQCTILAYTDYSMAAQNYYSSLTTKWVAPALRIDHGHRAWHFCDLHIHQFGSASAPHSRTLHAFFTHFK